VVPGGAGTLDAAMGDTGKTLETEDSAVQDFL
jgi:hypothetical protein